MDEAAWHERCIGKEMRVKRITRIERATSGDGMLYVGLASDEQLADWESMSRAESKERGLDRRTWIWRSWADAVLIHGRKHCDCVDASPCI